MIAAQRAKQAKQAKDTTEVAAATSTTKKPKVVIVLSDSEEEEERAPTQELGSGWEDDELFAAMDTTMKEHEKKKEVAPATVPARKGGFVDYPLSSDEDSISDEEEEFSGSEEEEEEESEEESDEEEDFHYDAEERFNWAEDAMNEDFPQGRNTATWGMIKDMVKDKSLSKNAFYQRVEMALKSGKKRWKTTQEFRKHRAFLEAQALEDEEEEEKMMPPSKKKKEVAPPRCTTPEPVATSATAPALPFECEEDTGRKRFRSYAFTGNNMGEEARRDLEGVLRAAGALHIVMGMEVGEKGTKHIQGNVYFAAVKSFKQARDLLKGCHVSATRMVAKSIEYCKKEGKFTEWGTVPVLEAKVRGKLGGEKEKLRWSTALGHLKAGRLELVDPQLQVQHFGNLLKIKEHYMAEVWPQYRFDLRECYWFFGEAGTGKTRMAKKLLGGHTNRAYFKVPDTGKWFCNVNAEQSTIIMDDYAPEHTKLIGAMMKQWYDAPMCRVETKGGSVMVNFAAGVVTSNYRLDQCFTGVDYPAMARRFTQVFFGEKENTPAGMIHSSALPRYFKHLVVMAQEGAEATHVRRQEDDEKPLAFTHESHKKCEPEDGKEEQFEEE